MFSLACNLIKNDVKFLLIQISLKKLCTNNVDFSTTKITSKKRKWKHHGFFSQRNYTEERPWKRRGFFDHRNYTKKVCGKNVDLSTIEITSKKYVEMTYKFVEIRSLTYQHNIDVDRR